MSDTINTVFDFACANPDYWQLMRETHEPAEVSELEGRRREAFNAARQEVQRQYCALLDEVHAKIKAKADGGALGGAFDASKKQPSYDRARFEFQVLSGRGKQTWATISIEKGENGRINAYCGLRTAAARAMNLVDAFRSALPEGRVIADGQYVWVEEFIRLGDSMSDIANRLVDDFWCGVEAYLKALERPSERAGADGYDGEEPSASKHPLAVVPE